MAVVEQDGAQHRSLGLEVVRRDGGLLERGHAPRRAVVMGRRVIMGAGRRWSWAQAGGGHGRKRGGGHGRAARLEARQASAPGLFPQAARSSSDRLDDCWKRPWS